MEIEIDEFKGCQLNETLIRIRAATEAAQEKIDSLRIDGLIRHVADAYRALGHAEGKAQRCLAADDKLLRNAIICAAELRSAITLKRRD